MPKLIAFTVLMLFSTQLFAKAAPPFRGETIEGKSLALQDRLQPQRFLLLSFWATWCEPCIKELGTLSSKLSEGGAPAVDMLTVNVNTPDDASEVKPTLRLNRFTFPVILDPTHSIFSRYTENKALPFSVLIDSRGEIIETFSGYDEAMYERLVKGIHANKNTPPKS